MGLRNRIYIGFSTVPDRKSAREIIGRLLDLRLIACAQILGPVESYFTWKGKRCKSREYLIKMKFIRKNHSRLKRELILVHPYDTPEFLVVAVDQVSEKYLQWVEEVSS